MNWKFCGKQISICALTGILTLLRGMTLYAQPDRKDPGFTDDPDFGTYIESVFSSREEEVSEDVYESFLHLYQHPINLNVADRGDLQSILLLNDQEIGLILEHREKYGGFLSLQELFLIEGIDSSRVLLLKEFLTVEQIPHRPLDSLSFMKRITHFAKHNLILRHSRILEKKKGFANRSDPEALLNKRYYVGSPDQLYLRYSLEVPGDFKLGLTTEKDAGELIYFSPKEKQYGFDHYSGYMEKKYRSWFKRVILGDYTIHVGQGLVLGNGLFIGKGTEPIRTAIRYGQGPSPYQGATEYGYYRGLALEFGGDKWGVTTFVSQKGTDASVEIQSEDGSLAGSSLAGSSSGYSVGNHSAGSFSVIRNIQKTGYHRTPAELIKKNAALLRSAGILLHYQSPARNINVGISGVWNKLNLLLNEKRNYYNLFDFSGWQHFNLGINYHYYRGKISVFGELAFSNPSGWAVVQGIVANLGSGIETVIHIRHYGKSYFTFNGRSFGEYTGTQNEQGIYWGVKLPLVASLDVNFYFDMFRSNWLRYGVASPSTGYEWMTCLKYKVGQHAGLDFYYQEENKIRNLPVNAGKEYVLSPGVMRKVRFTYQYLPENGFLLRSRIQWTHYGSTSEKNSGMALIQDMGYKFARGYIKGRLAYFRTNGYYTRQYVYEPDLLFYYSVPAYYGHGLRYLMLFKIAPIKILDLWIKFGQYQFFDRDVMGTGLEEITGHKKTEIRCQIRIKF